MNTLLAFHHLAANFADTSVIGLLERVAIVCVVLWAIWALLAYAGITIPQPVRIILIALVSILLIIWLFQIFAQLV